MYVLSTESSHSMNVSNFIIRDNTEILNFSEEDFSNEDEIAVKENDVHMKDFSEALRYTEQLQKFL